MNRILGVIAAAALFAAGSALAAAPAGKVTVVGSTEAAKDKQGPVAFPHDKHTSQKCTACHADEKGGKVAGGLDMKKGHEMCQKCHNDTAKADAAKAALKACTNCHAKK